MADLILEQMVKYHEEYVSRALNTKFAGVLDPGVYKGFVVKPGGGLRVSIERDEDYPFSVAVVERDGHSVTVKGADAGTVAVPVQGTHYVCLEAYYALGNPGYQQIVFRAVPEAHHVVLGKLSIPALATEITADMISEDGRMVGSPTLWHIHLAAKFTDTQVSLIDLSDRLSNLENWAKAEGYDPNELYSGQV